MIYTNPLLTPLLALDKVTLNGHPESDCFSPTGSPRRGDEHHPLVGGSECHKDDHLTVSHVKASSQGGTWALSGSPCMKHAQSNADVDDRSCGVSGRGSL